MLKTFNFTCHCVTEYMYMLKQKHVHVVQRKDFFKIF